MSQKISEFEADLEPETGAPRVRFNFDNGWSLSIVLTTGTRCETRFHTASVAACPTGQWGKGRSELLTGEGDADEVAQLISAVALRPALAKRGAV